MSSRLNKRGGSRSARTRKKDTKLRKSLDAQNRQRENQRPITLGVKKKLIDSSPSPLRKPPRTYDQLTMDLINASNRRQTNISYRNILTSLDSLTHLADDAEPDIENIDDQLNNIKTINSLFTAAQSTHLFHREDRNTALSELKKSLDEKKQTLLLIKENLQNSNANSSDEENSANDLLIVNNESEIGSTFAGLIPRVENNTDSDVTASRLESLNDLKSRYKGFFNNFPSNTDGINGDLNNLSDQLKLISKERKQLITKDHRQQKELVELNKLLEGNPENSQQLMDAKEKVQDEILKQFNQQKELMERLKAKRNFLVKVKRIQSLELENKTTKPPDVLAPFIQQLKNDLDIVPQSSIITGAERKEIVKQFNQENRKKELAGLLSVNHLDAIANASKKYNYIISIRETGALSVKRIDQGAKPKPHTILEKSIKQSSINNAYGIDGSRMFDKINELGLLGFVGHWNNSKLEGLRVDGYENTQIDGRDVKDIVAELGLEIKKIPGDANGAYISIDLENDASLNKIKEFVALEGHPKALYTGDYDMHETYKNNRQIVEGSVEKKQLIERLNNAVSRSAGNESRTAKVTLDPKTNLIHVNGEYAMFQHGDQATYRMNQILEARKHQWEKDKQEGRLSEEDLSVRVGIELATLVAPVATESDEPMAWVVNGEWYVTRNIDEHNLLRAEFGLTKPNTWQDNLVVRKRVEVILEDKPFPGYQPKEKEQSLKQFIANKRRQLASNNNTRELN